VSPSHRPFPRPWLRRGVLALLLGAVLLGAPAAVFQGTATAGGGKAPADREPAAPELVPATADQLLALAHRARAGAVLLNVWATWCLPCREEIPDLLRLRSEYASRGLELILVSADFDDQAAEAGAFLVEHGVDFRTYLKQGKDQAFIEAFSPEWSGALPATFVFGPRGKLREFWEGKASYDTLVERVNRVLGGVPPGEEGR